MHALGRLVVTAAVTVAFVGLLVFASPGVLGRLGIHVGELPETLRQLRDIEARGEALDARTAAVIARTAILNEVVSDLIDGKISLLQAVARVRDLCATDTALWECIGSDIPGASDGERRCRRVIRWVQERLHANPLRAGAVCGRLERELDQLIRDHGTVIVP